MHPSRHSTLNRIKLFVVFAVVVMALALVSSTRARPSPSLKRRKRPLHRTTQKRRRRRPLQLLRHKRRPLLRPPKHPLPPSPQQPSQKHRTTAARPKSKAVSPATKYRADARAAGTGRQSKIDAQGKDGVGLSCTSCHGGNPFGKTQADSHVKPSFPEVWTRDGKPSSGNPENTNALLERESYEFVRSIQPICVPRAKLAARATLKKSPMFPTA
jgi:hypothetical protein